MTRDEETWERRWIKAIKTIAEREEQIDELKAQVERLLAKEGERIGRALREGETRDTVVERLNEPRRDANGDPIPWPESADYFMAFDPENPDIPTD